MVPPPQLLLSLLVLLTLLLLIIIYFKGINFKYNYYRQFEEDIWIVIGWKGEKRGKIATFFHELNKVLKKFRYTT